MSDSARRGVIESQVNGPYWAVRFADKIRNIRRDYLQLLPSNAASFEPWQASLSALERRASATESSKRGLSVAASTKKCVECQITLMAGKSGPSIAS